MTQVLASRLHLVVVSGDEGGESLRTFVHGTGSRCDAQDCITPTDLPVRLAQGRPDAVVVHVRGHASDVSASISQATRAGIPVIAVGPVADASLVLEVLRLGARDYVDGASSSAALADSLEGLVARREMGHAPGRSVAVLSAQPGVGVTTVASALAFEMASRRPERVALAELGSAVPELAILLDAQPVQSLADLVDRHESADVVMLRQAMLPHAGGVHLLLQDPKTRRSTHPGPIALRRILSLLRVSYETTVLDLGHEAADWSLEALRLSEAVLVVCRIDVPGTRLTRRLLDDLAAQGIAGSKIHVVFNQYGRRGELDSASALQVIGRDAASWLPEAPGQVNAARNRGVPLTQAGRFSRLTRAIGKLSAALARVGR
jgi:pilus assembly protein CpaE